MLKNPTCVIALLLLACSSALAVPVQWVLSGATFTTGGTASGSFVYDADTNTYSSINVTVAGGTAAGISYIAPHSFATGSVPIFVTLASGDLSGTRVLVIALSSALTNAGGTLNLSVLQEGTCANSDITCTTATQFRSGSGGAVTSVAAPTVPAISPAVLFATILLLAGISVFALRRSASAHSR